ncbi:DUF397 domain-containing protein [Paractinoplanes hotanensis]|uniref:DUF397 domain-containing protein n=1 Tax=Paractinoplanes hotanensis TaxID=2906497 RepID=A0ABT0XYW2_9ACTN|nr:DUF397 domain-containing protein [Actinoplanes hotanensis]MCM4078289.1 DUF397 domain-containing protein [Actinoplanes hotanensis]
MSDVSERLVWRKSSGSLNGDCVEVAPLPDGVAVRDSKNPDGPMLAFTHSEWRAFIAGAIKGEFDDL